MRSLHLADALLFGINVSFASHILLAQQGIRLLRQAPTPYLNGGSRLTLRVRHCNAAYARRTETGHIGGPEQKRAAPSRRAGQADRRPPCDCRPRTAHQRGGHGRRAPQAVDRQPARNREVQGRAPASPVPCQNPSRRTLVCARRSRGSVIFVDESAEYWSSLDRHSQINHAVWLVVRRLLLSALVRAMLVVVRLPLGQN